MWRLRTGNVLLMLNSDTPYRPPESLPEAGAAWFDRLGRRVILLAVWYMPVCCLYVCVQAYREHRGADVPILLIVPFAVSAVVLNWIALCFTLRDWRLRSFSSNRLKVIWLLLILLTGGVGWLVYIFKYALKRQDAMVRS